MYCAGLKSFVVLQVLFLYSIASIHSEIVTDFYIETFAGLKNGSVSELVYENDDRISKLDWQQNVSPSIGLVLRFNLWQFFIKSKVESSIPSCTGVIQDYDYLLSGSNEVSHYSRHDAYLDKDMVFDATLGGDIPFGSVYNLSPFIGFIYQNRKWSAVDGYLQYPLSANAPWTGNEPKDPLMGTVMSYEQALWYPYFGIDNSFYINSKFRFGLSFSYIPYIFVDSLDSHFLRLKQFYDTLRGGYGGNIGIWLSITPFENNCSFTLSLNYKLLNVSGQTAARNVGIGNDEFVTSDGYTAGSISSILSVSIGFFINPW